MSDDNKENLFFFIEPSMLALYQTLQRWQSTHKKRFLSLSIQREGDSVACLALTNPSEVVIVARDGANGSYQEVGRYGDKLMVRS